MAQIIGMLAARRWSEFVAAWCANFRTSLVDQVIRPMAIGVGMRATAHVWVSVPMRRWAEPTMIIDRAVAADVAVQLEKSLLVV